MTKFLGIVALIEFFLLIIFILVIIILANILKKKRIENIRLKQQDLIDKEKYKRKLINEREYYDEKAKSAKDSTDIVGIITELLSDNDYNPR